MKGLRLVVFTLALNHNASDQIDLIYEGITTPPLICLIPRSWQYDQIDLIYEGITTCC